MANVHQDTFTKSWLGEAKDPHVLMVTEWDGSRVLQTGNRFSAGHRTQTVPLICACVAAAKKSHNSTICHKSCQKKQLQSLLTKFNADQRDCWMRVFCWNSIAANFCIFKDQMRQKQTASLVGEERCFPGDCKVESSWSTFCV